MGICRHLEIGINNQNFLKHLKSAAYSLNSCNDSFIFRYDTHTAQEPGSLVWCHAILSLQFSHVSYIACRGRLRHLGADSSKIGVHCVTVTWQRTFTSSCGSRRLAACEF